MSSLAWAGWMGIDTVAMMVTWCMYICRFEEQFPCAAQSFEEGPVHQREFHQRVIDQRAIDQRAIDQQISVGQMSKNMYLCSIDQQVIWLTI